MKIDGSEYVGGYGFCTADGSSHVENKGLTIRAHMSIEFLKGILSAQNEMRASGRQPDRQEMEAFCLEAVMWSDELIKQLNA